MKKLVKTLIFTATYCLSQTIAYAHGAHGSDTGLMHQFTEPQHLIGLIAVSAALSLFILLRKAKTQH